MKIDNGQTNFDPTARAAQADNVKHGRHHGGTHKTSATAQNDSVSVSPAAQFANQAISASQSSPDVRPDVVARARQLLADGKVGNDPYRLADALIDHALDSND